MNFLVFYFRHPDWWVYKKHPFQTGGLLFSFSFIFSNSIICSISIYNKIINLFIRKIYSLKVIKSKTTKTDRIQISSSLWQFSTLMIGDYRPRAGMNIHDAAQTYRSTSLCVWLETSYKGVRCYEPTTRTRTDVQTFPPH